MVHNRYYQFEEDLQALNLWAVRTRVLVKPQSIPYFNSSAGQDLEKLPRKIATIVSRFQQIIYQTNYLEDLIWEKDWQVKKRISTLKWKGRLHIAFGNKDRGITRLIAFLIGYKIGKIEGKVAKMSFDFYFTQWKWTCIFDASFYVKGMLDEGEVYCSQLPVHLFCWRHLGSNTVWTRLLNLRFLVQLWNCIAMFSSNLLIFQLFLIVAL